MRTLTLSGDVTAEGAFTLSISQSNVPLGDASTDVTLTFRDNRAIDESSETRTITISIAGDDIPPTIPDDRIGDPNNLDDPIVAGATQFSFGINSAYDRVGSMDDLNNATFTRDVDYVITITRLASGDKPLLTLPSITMSATELGLDIMETLTRPSPEFLPIEILLTRNDVTLIPNDDYMVDISVADRAGNPNTADDSVTYNTEFFKMDKEGAYDELAALNIDCSTGDSDGIADAYELHIGTDCNGSVDDYIGSNDPADISRDVATIEVPPSSPQDAQV